MTVLLATTNNKRLSIQNLATSDSFTVLDTAPLYVHILAHQQPDPLYMYPLGDVDLATLIQSNVRLLYGRHRIYDVVRTQFRYKGYSDRALLIGYSPSYTKTGERGAIEAFKSRGTISRE
ncbi:hypothetical protein E8E11_003399 [Didymella keratinophila]|nr:hypothetical protein E8E11_003399 [Didymella keratinophila]